ncbi:MAG: PadR family transcriptional regulator [Bacteroidales bacterium]|nr:PadR family transcriptional regulator [Bacteroidales bacterium]
MTIEEKTSNIKSQMRKGMLEYCILLVLKDGRKYTSDIIDRMRESGLAVVEGTLYTLLNRLRKEGKLNYEWEESPKGPPRKYYMLTPAGSEVLHYMSEAWDEIANTVNSLRMMDESNNGSNDDPNKEFNLEKTEKNENNI